MGGIDTTVIAGAATAGVLLIFGVIIFAIWWRRNKGSLAGELDISERIP